MQKRSLTLLVALLFAFSGIMMRLMQLVREPISETSGTRSTVTVTVAQMRGTIYDRNLCRLTNQTEEYAAAVVAVPEAMAALSETFSGEDWEAVSEQLKTGKPVTLQSETPLPLTKGIRQFTAAKRYSEEQTAAHLIGYLGDDGVNGACGVEKAFNEELKKASGSVTVRYQTDGYGGVLQGGEVQVSNTLFRADAGVALTIDSEIQRIVEIVVSKHITKGAAVVLDPSNGEILALASFPGFSANRLSEYLERQDAPLFNRALAAYNCGSVFKTVSTITALESGVPSTQTFTCAGAVTVGKNRIKCHQVLGHGLQDMMSGFTDSCNAYYIQLMQLTGGTPLYRTACALGFDRPIVLAEDYITARATLPSENTFLMNTALANLSFGQGELLATPIHIAQMTACVVNAGKAFRPNLYKGSVDTVGNLTLAKTDPPVQVCSATTANQVKAMMRQVVENGTGKAAKPTIGGAGGKTGTAQTGWVGEDGETIVQNWFTGFYPFEEPQYVITLLAEDSKRTGEATAPVFAELCDALYRAGHVE